MKFNPRAIQTTLTLLFFILSVISVFTIDSSHNTEVQKIFANLQETTDQKLTETVTKTSSITLSEVDKAIQNIDGKQGDKGDRGPVGLQGPRGLRGEKGLTGEQGLIGLQGIQGEQGINGSQGIQGEQGIQGNAGLQGEQGPQGATGSQGIQGEQGLQGAPGTSSILTASNGLNILTTDLRLGGDLTSNTSIPFSTFDLAYNINGTGKFKIENNGTPLISINSNGSILLENSAVVYDDLMVPGLSMKTDSSAPDLISFGPAQLI